MQTQTVIRTSFLATGIALSFATAAFPDELPQDIQSFEEQYRLCEHFRGEHTGGSSPERDQQVNEQLAKVCPAADQSLIQLRAKYRLNQKILEYLASFSCSGPRSECEQGT